MIELSSTLSLVHLNEPGKKSHNMLNLLLLLLLLTAVFDEVNIEELFNRVCVPLVYRQGLDDFVGIVEQFNNRVCPANVFDAQATVPLRSVTFNKGRYLRVRTQSSPTNF